MPGLGPVSSLALAAAFHRHNFRRVDAFLTFIGLDVRVRDSGRFLGRRKLTKQGDPEMRRLWYNAAMAGCKDSHGNPYYQSLRERGISGTAALMILARKIVRVRCAVVEKQVPLEPEMRNLPCTAI